MSRRIKAFGIDTSHFTGQTWNKGIPSSQRKTVQEILVLLPEGSNRPKLNQLRRALDQSEVPYECECGNTGDWLGKSLTLEIDHIDGNWLNNTLENLRYLCPNCHSQQESTNKPHKYRNKH